MEVLDSGFQVLDPGFFVGGTRFRILSLATEADMYSGLQSPGFQIPRPKIFGFLIPRSELPYVWRQATLEAECSLRLELTCYFIIISFFLNCMLYVNVVILSSIKGYKIKYKKKLKKIRKIIKLALSAALICSIAKGYLWTTNKYRRKQIIEMSLTNKVTHPNRPEANQLALQAWPRIWIRDYRVHKSS